jgi:hypothetical protein
MAGPPINIPSPTTPIVQMFKDDAGNSQMFMSTDWAAFLSMVAQASYGQTRSGPTTERPSTDFKSRYVGMPYFDTTLGLPVFLKYATSSVWVKADGTVA